MKDDVDERRDKIDFPFASAMDMLTEWKLNLRLPQGEFMTSLNVRNFPALLSLLAVLAIGSIAAAQRPSHYYPARPPISPYMGYSNVNTTGLPAYYATVRPTMDFQSVVRSYRTGSAFAPAPVAMRTTLDDERVADMVAQRIEVRQSTGVGATSVPSTFMTYSHFYTPRSITARGGR